MHLCETQKIHPALISEIKNVKEETLDEKKFLQDDVSAP